MSPEQIAKPGNEASHQRALFAWCALHIEQYPELKWFHAIPNGGSRGDNAKSRAIQGGALKAEGVKSGVADCFLPVRRGVWSGLYIEMKKPDGKPSKEQKEFGVFVQLQGFGFVVCYGWSEAVKVLQEYLNHGQPVQ